MQKFIKKFQDSLSLENNEITYQDQTIYLETLFDDKPLLHEILGKDLYFEFDALAKKIKNKIRKGIESAIFPEQATNKGEIFAKFMVLVDARTRQYFTYERNTKKLTDEISGKVIVDAGFYPEEDVLLAKTVFEANEERVLWEDETGMTVLNTYIQPEWKKARPVENPLVIRFIEHFFPNKEHRRWFLAWFYQAIVGRNETIPIILERQGNGKNTLVEGILFPMISHYHKASQSLLHNKVFNSELRGKRIVFYDEIALQKKHVNTLKSYTNELIPIEGKGKEVVNTKLNTSFIGCGNLTEGRVYTTADERRLSFLDSVTTKLPDSFTEEEIRYLHKEFSKDFEAQRALFDWLEGQDLEQVRLLTPIKGKKYYKCFFGSQERLLRTLIYNYILKDEEIDYKTLVRNYKELGGTKPAMQFKLIESIGQCNFGGVMPCFIQFENENSNLATFIPNPEFVKMFKFLLEEEERARNEVKEFIGTLEI